MPFLVDLNELGGKVGGYAVAQLLDGVHAGSLEQLGELRADAVDAEQVGMVGPPQDQFLGDTRILGNIPSMSIIL